VPAMWGDKPEAEDLSTLSMWIRSWSPGAPKLGHPPEQLRTLAVLHHLKLGKKENYRIEAYFHIIIAFHRARYVNVSASRERKLGHQYVGCTATSNKAATTSLGYIFGH
jgi:hypothetical protein